jgi:metal iron transporter
MLVASQVALSIVLPFVIFPLVYIAASKNVMTISNPPGVPSTKDQPEQAYHSDAVEKISFASHWSTQTVGYFLFALVTVANCYVLVELALGLSA